MDLSSLEGPPTLDDRFSYTITSPSPVSPMGAATWERSRRRPSIPATIPQTPVSPLSESPKSSFSPNGSIPSTLRRRNSSSEGGMSIYSYSHNYSYNYNYNYNYSNPNPNPSNNNNATDRQPQSPTNRAATHLRGSRSFSSLQEPASMPPRPRSADSSSHHHRHSSRSSPRLITNGRLVWLEEQQIWVLLDAPLPQHLLQQHQQHQQTHLDLPSLTTGDPLPRAMNTDTVHVAQHADNPLIQYYDPITYHDNLPPDIPPPPSYESHQFTMGNGQRTGQGNGNGHDRGRGGRLHPPRITIPIPHSHHRPQRPPRARTQWASVAERLGRSPFA